MTAPDAGAGSAHGNHPHSGVLPLAGATAIAVADTLSLVAELPSTPRLVAEEAGATAGELSQRIAAGGRHPHEVEAPACCVVSAAGILALVGAMPSTPPAVATDASDRSAELWDHLADAARVADPDAPAG